MAALGCRPGEPDASAPEGTIDLLFRRPKSVAAETRRVKLAVAPAGDLLEGWAWPEWNADLGTEIVWAVAEKSEVGIRLLEPRELQFLVAMAPLDTGAAQRVAVAMNGETVATFDLAATLREYRFLVPERLLERGRNVLSFQHSVLTRPADERDSRRLAVSYKEMLTGPACGALRPRGLPPSPGVHARREGDVGLRAVGPVEFSYRFKVPPGGRLEVVSERTSRSPAAVSWRARLRVAREKTWTDLGGARLARPWFGGRKTDSTALDLGAWSGRKVELRLEVAPELCRGASGELTFRRLAVQKTIDKAATPSG